MKNCCLFEMIVFRVFFAVVFQLIWITFLLPCDFLFWKSRCSPSLSWQMWSAGSVWPPAFLRLRPVRAFQENQYLAATPAPSFQSSICPGTPAWWSREEQVTETPFKQRGECTQPSPWRRLFHHACVRGHALKEPRANSFKPNTTIVSVQRSCIGTQLSIHGCLCTPSMHWCTAACGAAAAAATADVMLVGEEEVVISQRQKVQHVYFYTGVLLFGLADHQRQPMRHVCDWLWCFRDKLPKFLHHPQLPWVIINVHHVVFRTDKTKL